MAPTETTSALNDAAFEALWLRCQARFPSFTTPMTTLKAALKQQLERQQLSEQEGEAWLARLLVEDLYLALACLEGEESAMQTFRELYLGQLRGLSLRYAPHATQAEDLEQTLMLSLFVDTPSRQAKLRSYTGQGALRAWLQVCATRTYIDLTRAATRQDERPLEDELLTLFAQDMKDIELEYFQQTYSAPFKAAFAQAVAELTPRQRNLLSQHILQQLNIDQLGALYNVHRATAARWLDVARQTLAKRTRAIFGQQLNLSDSELDSVMRLVQSRVSLSLSRLLELPTP